MHNPLVSSHHSIVRITTIGVAGILLALAQQPGALSQSAQANSAPSSSAPANEARPMPNSHSQGSLVAVPEDFAGLKLAPGFLLNVQIYDEPDFSGPTRVDNDGNISIAFLKPIHVSGDSVSKAKERIQQAFRDQGILKNPQISVDVQQFATTTATVMGEVQNPGKVELLAPHSLLEVIGMTGGETQLAGNEIELRRANGDPSSKTYHYAKGGDTSAIRDVMVNPGDTVIVNRTGIVYVLGAVNRPGGYAMQEQGELNVAQAISLAQGLALQAKVGALRVVQHRSDGQMVEVPISYNKIMEGKEQPLSLSAGDIVYVPISKLKTVLGSTVSLVGQTTAAAIYVVH